MGLTIKKNRFAIIVLVITVILLFFSRLTTSWDLYTESGFQPNQQKPSGTNQNDENFPTKVAAILETRPLENLIPLIVHFSSVLGPEWPIHIFTSPDNRKAFQKSAAFTRQVKAGYLHLEDLPLGVPSDFAFHEPALFSEFMTQAWFWEKLAPAEHVLMFRADSMICAHSERSADDFLEYDFIGAPFDEKDAEKGVSGGLSLRNRQMMLDITKNSNWANERTGDRDESGRRKVNFEDQWFWEKMKKFPAAGDGRKKAKLPSMKTASEFAVGSVWVDKPLGYDLGNKSHDSRMEEILRWCPEYSMTVLETVPQR